MANKKIKCVNVASNKTSANKPVLNEMSHIKHILSC